MGIPHVLNTGHLYDADDRQPLTGEDRKRAMFFFEQDLDLTLGDPSPTENSRGDLLEMLKECIAELAAGASVSGPPKKSGGITLTPPRRAAAPAIAPKKHVILTATEDCDMSSEDEEHIIDPDHGMVDHAQPARKNGFDDAPADYDEDALELPCAKKAKYAYI